CLTVGQPTALHVCSLQICSLRVWSNPLAHLSVCGILARCRGARAVIYVAQAHLIFHMAEANKEFSAMLEAPRRRHGLRLLEEVGAIITHASDLPSSVQGIVETIAEHLSMEVCSIYIFDRARQVLTLFATTGLDPSSVGKVSMGVDEGLTGIVVQKLEPVLA